MDLIKSPEHIACLAGKQAVNSGHLAVNSGHTVFLSHCSIRFNVTYPQANKGLNNPVFWVVQTQFF